MGQRGQGATAVTGIVLRQGQKENNVTPRTLIADDQPDVLEALCMLLRREGHEIETALSPSAVLEAVRCRDFDLLLIDLNYARDTTSGREGLELLERLHALDEQLPIVVMTAWGNTNLAVEAMRRGACDYVEKPWNNAHLIEKLSKPLAKSAAGGAAHPSAREMADARSMQQGLLLREIPRFQGADIGVEWHPARAVSGDVFDLMQFPDGSGAIMIADAIGKGMPAALLASHLQATVQALSSERISPGKLMAAVNASVCGRLEHGRFVSLLYIHFDLQRGRLRFCNAGHPAALLIHRDGRVERLEEGGPVLGEFSGRQYDEKEVVLRECDRIVAYTDGISEARNARGEEFGELRILKLAERAREARASEFSRRLVEEARQHGGDRLKDDATVVVLSVKGA
jgi:sigma-B regulation protein RsbU (phosphoserine phosphatase)